MSNDFTTQFAIKLPDGEMFLSPHSGAVVTWSEREGAEQVLEQLRAHATAMGIRDYAGAIVYRHCTPFVNETDHSEQLVDELTAWLHRETGGGR